MSGKGAPAFSLSNDAAIYSPEQNKELIFTKDTLVAGVHFFENDDPFLVAQKSLRVNLSDLASMGAQPLGYLLSLSLPKKNFDIEKWLAAFSAGLKQDQERYNWKLWGGDTVSTSGPVTISVTAIGQTDKGVNISRSGAKVGDDIYVSGTLGDAAGGLVVLQDDLDRTLYDELINRYYLPEPRLKLGRALTEIITSMMDVSDGLMGDISHICENSGVGAILNLEKIPSSQVFGNLLATNKAYSRLAWSGGDDYELLFTAPKNKNAVIKNLSDELGIKLTKIGEITKALQIKLLDDDGSEITQTKKGFRHF
ncbi:MAG: thiamine-phosphate kinase [Emcibacteraceae bacterium]|nr:thiamine-phosphate kinase [Emcibacteraceae bacterium]